MFTEYSINGYWFILFLTLLVLTHLSLEIFFHTRRLKKIKYRIHVNGTRGKSSVARLIAAGLRGGNVRTVCKTTGTMARFIDIEGNETPVIRLGRTNVIEQVKVVKKASLFKPQALVIECMALQPLLQSLCELRLVQSTHGVLTNARADHLDVMGPTEQDVALALAGTMPVKGTFFTPERRHLAIFVEAAHDRGSEVVEITQENIDAITDEELSRFSYLEYKVNVALALAVCAACGVTKDDALQGMWAAVPDPGALIIKTIAYNGKKVTLANGFAANDPESTGQLWHNVLQRIPEEKEVIGLINCREDRADRSRQMAEAIYHWQNNQHLIAIGSGTEFFLKALPHTEMLNVVDAERWGVERLLTYVTQTAKADHILLIGVCNIAKIGFELLNYFCSKETIEHD